MHSAPEYIDWYAIPDHVSDICELVTPEAYLNDIIDPLYSISEQPTSPTGEAALDCLPWAQPEGTVTVMETENRVTNPRYGFHEPRWFTKDTEELLRGPLQTIVNQPR